MRAFHWAVLVGFSLWTFDPRILYVACHVADGADVVRVERIGANPGPSMQRGKRSIEVDLKSKEGVELVLKMCEKADVIMEPYRPGVMERLGLGPDVVLKR